MCKSLRDTSSRLAELGWLHNKIRKYTDSHSLDRAFGLVGQVGNVTGLEMNTVCNLKPYTNLIMQDYTFFWKEVNTFIQ